MHFWTPKLNRLHRLLTQIYPVKESTYLPVESAGLSRGDIEFSDKAVDNWYHILERARAEGKLIELLQYVKEYSRSPEFAKALEDYVNTPDWLGGGDPVLERAFNVLLDRLKCHWRAALAALVALILTIVVAVAYYLFKPVMIDGYISCDGSSTRRGEHLPAATVIVPGTIYKAVTNAQGYFTMRVPRSLKFDFVEVLYGLDRIPVRRDQLKNSDHQVVPCHSGTPPKVVNIPFQWWKETLPAESVLTCPARGGLQPKVYTLKPDGPIQKTTSASKLYLNIVLLGGWTFIDAEPTRPRVADDEDTPWYETVVQPDSRQWSFQMPADQLDLSIQICVVADSETSRLSEAALVSNYFFK